MFSNFITCGGGTYDNELKLKSVIKRDVCIREWAYLKIVKAKMVT